MQKFKIGDFVQLRKKCLRQYCAHLREYYRRPDGSIPNEYTGELAAVLGAQHLDFPLVGYVIGYGSDIDEADGDTDQKFTRVCLTNRFGTLTSYFSGGDLLRKKRFS